MKVLSIRRVTNDRRHNAFTGACWFKGNLYVGYRQGDDHVCDQGRIIVERSRDKGITWDTVTVLRGNSDTRDAHLYTDGDRLFAVCFEHPEGGHGRSGFSVTENGDHWTPYQPYEGTDGFVLWRPVWHNNKHYCAAYRGDRDQGFGVHWFESDNGHHWQDVRTIHDSPDDMPCECFLEIQPDGTAIMLMRCEVAPKHPYLCQSQYPFESWKMQKLEDILLTGPALWTCDGRIYIGGRWHPHGPKMFDEGGYSAHTGIFRVHDDKTALQCVLPAGPHPDHSYIGVARWPDDPNRFALSFYGNAIAHEDPAIDQWTHPDVFLADVLCGDKTEL